MSRIPKWPFPDDKPVSRSRRMALAYRTTAQEAEQLLTPLREAAQIIADAVEQADKRLLAYDSPKTLHELQTALKQVRAVLDAGAPTQTVAQLDQRFTSWGEFWHCEQPDEYGPEDYVRAADGAKLIGISHKTLNTMRNRGQIPSIFNVTTGGTGGYWYKVADLYAAKDAMPSRGWRRKSTADTLDANGTGDSDEPQQ